MAEMKEDRFFTDNGTAVVSSDRVLYTASSFARSALLYLQETGSLTALRPHISSRSGLQSYLFFTVVSGSGMLTYEEKEYPLSAGSCVFIDCRRPYTHKTEENDLWSLRWCHFNGPTLSSVYDKYCERGGKPAFVPASSEMTEEILAKLTETARSSDNIRDMLINEQLSTLIRLIMSESWHPENKAISNKRASVLEVKKYLDEHYSEPIVLDDLSERFYISKFYLTHSFKEQFGFTINLYLQSVRITHAKLLLRFTNKTIEEIAAETGIPDPAYFSRLFKRIEGITPGAYRRQW